MPKAISDVLVIFSLHAVEIRHRPWQYLSAFATFPFGMLILTRYLLPEEAEAGPRLIAGTIIFTIGLGTVQSLPQVIASSRFSHQIELFVTSPIHQVSYAGGVVLYSCAHALVNTCTVLLLAPLLGIEVDLNPLFLPIALLTALSLTGVAVVIGTWAPTMRAAATMANLAGILLVLISPIYFPASRLPQPLETLTNVSPYTHAAGALNTVLSGSDGFVGEITILTAITAVGLSVGVIGMRWREA